MSRLLFISIFLNKDSDRPIFVVIRNLKLVEASPDISYFTNARDHVSSMYALLGGAREPGFSSKRAPYLAVMFSHLLYRYKFSVSSPELLSSSDYHS